MMVAHWKDFDVLNALIQKGKVVLHHTAAARGYVSRRDGDYIDYYRGKFGAGYKVHRPRWDTTNYHYVDYYIYIK